MAQTAIRWGKRTTVAAAPDGPIYIDGIGAAIKVPHVAPAQYSLVPLKPLRDMPPNNITELACWPFTLPELED